MQIQQLQAALAEEKRQRVLMQTQLAACMRRLDKLDPPETPLRAMVRRVEMGGNIRVNHDTGHVTLLRRLDFQPRHRNGKDEPTAVFRDPETAESICKDLAEISNIFRCDMTIEGHTKGGEGQFWQTLADGRARIVAEAMIDFGANPNLLHTLGLPGRMGKNEVRTEIFMDIRNIKDETGRVQEIDIIQNGRVVERDLYQAGRLVERDVAVPAPTQEIDIIAGGRVVERDFYQGGRLLEQDMAVPEVRILQGSLQAPRAIERDVVLTEARVAERESIRAYNQEYTVSQAPMERRIVRAASPQMMLRTI